MAHMSASFNPVTPDFKSAPPRWWFTKDELEALHAMAAHMSDQTRRWTLVDSTNEQLADTVAIIGGYRDIYIRKFKLTSTDLGYSFDVLHGDEIVRTRNFNQVQVEVQRFLLTCKRLDHVFERIAAQLDLEPLSPR